MATTKLCEQPLSLPRLKLPSSLANRHVATRYCCLHCQHWQAPNELLDVPFTNNTTQSLSAHGAVRPLPACWFWRAAVGRLRTPQKMEATAGFFCSDKHGRGRKQQTAITAIPYSRCSKADFSVETSPVSSTVLRKEEHSEGWGWALGHGRETTVVGALVPSAKAAFCKQAV